MQARVRVYTRPRCLFCHQVLDLLQAAGVDFVTEEILDRGQQEELISRHQAAAFPIVLIDGRYVGGYAHVLHLHSQGRLRDIATRPTSAADKPAANPPTAASSSSDPSAQSAPAPSRPSQRSLPSMVGTMSRLQQALSETDPKKR